MSRNLNKVLQTELFYFILFTCSENYNLCFDYRALSGEDADSTLDSSGNEYAIMHIMYQLGKMVQCSVTKG